MQRRFSLVTIIGFALLALLFAAPFITEALGQSFWLKVVNRAVILAIAAIGLNLILGFGGMVSFGHAAFIGLGAYAVGIPAYYDINNGLLHLVFVVLSCGIFAFLTGLVSLRTKGVHFIMITMAFAQMAYYAFVSIEEYGADDGLQIWSRSEFPLIDLEDKLTFYYVSWACLVIALYTTFRITGSRFGMVLRGARSNEARMHALGFPTFRYRLTAYVASGIICGIAGALLGNHTDFISPDMMGWTRSGELIFMVVLGGAGTLFGPLFGVTAFLVIEEVLSGITVYWHLIFGLILLGVVLFVKGGLAGLIPSRARPVVQSEKPE